MRFHGMTCFAGTSSQRPLGANPASTDNTASQTPARLDISDLGSVVWELFSAGLATRQNYRTGTKCYIEFCREQQKLLPRSQHPNKPCHICCLASHPASVLQYSKKLFVSCPSFTNYIRFGRPKDGINGPIGVCD